MNNVDIAGATSKLYSGALAASDEAYVFTVVVSNDITDCEVVSAPYYVYVNNDIQGEIFDKIIDAKWTELYNAARYVHSQ